MKTYTCPRCEAETTSYPAISRRDNRTEICPLCGIYEGMEDAKFAPPYTGKLYWKPRDQEALYD